MQVKNINTHFFCLDMGGTGTRGVLFDFEGNELARAVGKAGALSLGAQQSFNAISDIWDKVCLTSGHNSKNTSCVNIALGIAGSGLKKQTEHLRQLLSQFSNVVITGDGYGALIAASKGKPGALISVGTGVGALRLGSDGKTLAVSSWGFPAGDKGGGAWLGLTLFSDFLNAMDMIFSAPPIPLTLMDQIKEITGKNTQSIMGWQQNARPGDFGKLAPIIVAGAKEGDTYCQGLLNKAARHIARIAQTLQSEETKTIFLSGGLGPVLYPYCLKSTPGIDWCLSEADPINGVFLVASGQAPPLQLMVRPGLK
ncbi:MAG: hypothetical protein L3J13_02000 [Devosiaceae bacterium]|nr:hypothetical protein [Devosiaceae bacterium]